MYPTVLCRCGATIRANRFKFHIDTQCKALPDDIKFMNFILAESRKTRFGWLKSEGLNALGNRHWWKSVIENKTTLEDWTLHTPRPQGVVTPKSAQQFRQDRSGIMNPACKNKTIYDLGVLRKFAKDLWKRDVPIGEMHKIMADEFPGFRFQFADRIFGDEKKRGHNSKNGLLAYLLQMPIKRVVRKAAQLRGKKISAGQLGSEKFLEMASRVGSQMTSSFRVSKPQKILYNMVLQHDSAARMEFRIKMGRKWRSFDIYSPKLNAVIEMHGRVWHDLSKTTEGLRKITEKNVTNDIFKQSIALAFGYKYFVFWDDQIPQWEIVLRGIYEKTTG